MTPDESLAFREVSTALGSLLTQLRTRKGMSPEDMENAIASEFDAAAERCGINHRFVEQALNLWNQQTARVIGL